MKAATLPKGHLWGAKRSDAILQLLRRALNTNGKGAYRAYEAQTRLVNGKTGLPRRLMEQAFDRARLSEDVRTFVRDTPSVKGKSVDEVARKLVGIARQPQYQGKFNADVPTEVRLGRDLAHKTVSFPMGRPVMSPASSRPMAVKWTLPENASKMSDEVLFGKYLRDHGF